MSELTIAGSEIHAVSPEGKKRSMPLDVLYERVAGTQMDTGDLLMPDGVKAVKSSGTVAAWVHQTPPRVYKLRWIAKDSPARFGKDCKYREVVIALPYLIILAFYTQVRDGFITLSKSNECFFTNQPLSSLDDPLFYPALLNCSKFEPPEGKPLSWICTQHLNRSFDQEENLNKRLRRGFSALAQCLLEAGFNYSSEEHEASSWFTESRTVDPRIADVDQWQKATQKDPLFVLDLNWLPTSHSVIQVIERSFKNHQATSPKLNTAAAIERLVFTHQRQSRLRKPAAQPELLDLFGEF